MTRDGAAADDFAASFAELAAIGRKADGWHRHGYSPEAAAAARWFTAAAQARGLTCQVDAFGNSFAWWGPVGPGALLLCSHLDTVPAGGAYDGALGVVSALCAISAAERSGVSPGGRSVVVGAFAEEEGAAFGLACLGSGLASGALAPARALGRAGLPEAAAGYGLAPEKWPAAAGEPHPVLSQVAAAVELHVEQGRELADLGAPLGVATEIRPHGRWRLDVRGEPNHAGTTALTDRHDPALVLAEAIIAARALASALGAVATVGRVEVAPNATNGIAATVSCWLDARASSEELLDQLVSGWYGRVRLAAAGEGCELSEPCTESRSPAVRFDPAVRALLSQVLAQLGLPAPEVATAAGHDAGVLAGSIPTGMLFVRNPTGTSHSPAENATDQDCVTGIAALAALIARWVGHQ